jgi:hypothetical protein
MNKIGHPLTHVFGQEMQRRHITGSICLKREETCVLESISIFITTKNHKRIDGDSSLNLNCICRAWYQAGKLAVNAA